jgi:hypothetical protein
MPCQLLLLQNGTELSQFSDTISHSKMCPSHAMVPSPSIVSDSLRVFDA